MNPSPLVSVVMPVYDAAEYLEQSVNSILKQSLRDFEFIIVDDGSTDDSPKILDHYQELDSRVRVLHQENSGIGISLNRAMAIAAGKYIARMDSDDISLAKRLSKQAAFMESHPEIGICGTPCRYFGDRRGVGRPVTESAKIKSKLLFWPVMIHPTVMMRRQLIVDKGLFYRADFKEGEDYELWFRFSQCCRMANMREPLVLVRMHDDQKHRCFDDSQDEWGNRVRREAIRALGIEPSREDIELHLSLCRRGFRKSRDYVNRVEDWLCRLLDANERSRVLDTDTLAQVLFECWCPVCAFADESILWRCRKLTGSRLHVGYRGLLRGCTSFGARRVLRSLKRCVTGDFSKR